ncbi:CopY/TcrY family copper transport repressor [Streptococcus agalactiae]|uniref:CopY/TcrY family copper transport repressor n=1 Tax=Streptococcus agalactiae TaxID=1311 RepID=UPI002220C0AE|nr:CopY/TcrY family copper transport repressor [Streptococcus agalactiae]MCW1801626.1 CopY/TcrY family copper transport repressor [Streptococcus agalactiae]
MTISNAEWEIMRVVWAQQNTTSNEILAVLLEKYDWTPSTVKTLLRRLLDKGYVSREKMGKGFSYSPLIDEDLAMMSEVDSVLQKVCQTKHVAIVRHLLESIPMTEKDRLNLQASLEAKKGKTLERVACNCIPGQCQCY